MRHQVQVSGLRRNLKEELHYAKEAMGADDTTISQEDGRESPGFFPGNPGSEQLKTDVFFFNFLDIEMINNKLKS